MSIWPPSNAYFPMPSQRYYDQQTAGTSNPGSSAYVADEVYVVPFRQWTGRRVEFQQLRMDLDLNGTGSDVTANVAIYRDNGNGIAAGKLYEDTITFPPGGTGVLGTSIPFALSPGLYWVAWVVDGAVSVGDWDGGGAEEGYSILGDDDAEGSSEIPKAWGYKMAWPFATPLPDSFVGEALTYNTGVSPRICFRVQ